MTTVRRLTNSCLTVTTDGGTTLFDPGFFTYESGEVDLNDIGDVQTVLITHEHRDHVSPKFVRWLVDRGDDVTVHCNQPVADLLAGAGVEATTSDPPGVSSEDVTHEMLPNGATPPNRAYTLGGVLTHPGDSYQPTTSAPVLALPLITPWGTARKSVEFAQRLGPQQVIPIHDFYLSESGRSFITGLVGGILADIGIELIPLDWGDSATV